MTGRKILDLDVKPNPSEEKIFFGQYGNYIRTENVKHEFIKRLKEFSEGNVWFPKEIDFSKDTIRNMPPHAQRMFKLNICFQTLMDSGVDNAFSTVVRRLTTGSYPSLAYGRVATEESIHAESYSYGLNEMFGTTEAEKILDLAYEDPFIRTRLDGEVNEFSEVIRICLEQGKKDDEAKKAVLRMLLRIYFLEAVKFPFSFLITFTLNKNFNSDIQGITRMIKLIAHDELGFHVPLGKYVLRTLRVDQTEGFTHLFESGWFDKEAVRLGRESVESEKEWATYLLKDGEIPGFNQAIADHFLEYMYDTNVRPLNVDDVYGVQKNEIIRFFETTKNINLQNTAMQEAENSAYQKGVLKNDLHTYDTAEDIERDLEAHLSEKDQ
jgi:ribonucleoside-diphosphate reductase beta chain